MYEIISIRDYDGAGQDEINHILNRYATSKSTLGQTRRYGELLGGRFRLVKVVRIDRKDDGHDVVDKIFDYSYKSIEKLMKDGYRDALIQIDLQAVKNEFLKLENKFVKLDGKGAIDKKDKEIEKLEQLEQEFQQIQQNVKTENRYGTRTIVSQVEDFKGNVSALPDELKENNNRPIKEEKVMVLDAAKQFQETILLQA